MNGDRVRVVIAEDHPIYRDGLARALGWNHDIEVVAAVGDGQAALEAAREHAPCVLMVDYNLPGLNGVQIAGAVARDGLDCRVLLISATTEGPIVFEALERGASGYLGKDAEREQIVDAVLRVAKGQTVLPPEVATGLAGQIRMRSGSHLPQLSDREREVLRSFAAGLTIPQVARNLHLSPSTVKSHTQRLYEKLGVSDRAAVVAEAMRRGLLE
ncbi:response regulator [Longimycelium tulufanense]|uniref:response regulator n=1 Tax=Longimycelium tulufanense TaxID=907463 RepID=UPI0016684EFE|nr:response regulator transcription factor [Longimycelium tulufanense]